MTKAEKAPKNDMTDSKPGQKIAVATTSAVVIILTSTLTVALIGFGASVSDILEKADEFARCTLAREPLLFLGISVLKEAGGESVDSPACSSALTSDPAASWLVALS